MKKLLATMLALLMALTLLPTAAFATETGSATKTDSSVAYVVKKDGDTYYNSLDAAIAGATSGDAIKLLKDIKNDDLANNETYTLPASVTLDGCGKVISGNITVMIADAGGKITDVHFKDITDNKVPSAAENNQYGFQNKQGKLTAIYDVSNLSGKAEITNCIFENVAWEAVQLTPVAGAEIIISGNTFSTSVECQTVRFIHIESKTNVDFSAKITGNHFHNVKFLSQTGLEVYYPANANKLTLSGNCMDAPMAVCIGTGKSYNNAYNLSFPFVNENGTEAWPVAMAFDSSNNNKLYLTMKEALADTVKKDTYYVQGNATESISVTKDITLNMGANTLTGAVDVTADKTLTVKNGTLAITGGTFSGKLVVGDKGVVTVTGGTFASNPAAYVDDDGYTVVKGTDGRYTVKAVESGSTGGSTGGTTGSGTSSVILPTDTTPSSGSSASTSTETTATITKSDIDTNKGLVVKDVSETAPANATSVTFNNKAAKTIVTAAGDNTAALTLTVNTSAAEDAVIDQANQPAYNTAITDTDTENAVVVSIKLNNGNENIFTVDADGAYAIVEVPYKANLKDVTVQYLDGHEVKTLTKVAVLSDLESKSFSENANGFFYYASTTGVITMKLPHFSQYLLNGTVPTVNPPSTTTYTVTFNANGGTVTPATATTGTDGKLTILPTPTRNNYSFDGWFTAAQGGTQVTTATVFTTDATVYAHWTRNAHYGPIRVNTGSGSSTTTTTTVAAPKTADAGIAIYGVMAISSVLGMGYVGKKKF